MGRKKKTQSTQLDVIKGELGTLQTSYVDELDTNPEYSLEPDPLGALNMSVIEKDFIRHYVNFKNIGAAAELAMIDADTARSIFISYKVQQEIRRINRAMYHRQFAAKLVSFDDIAGYLSSLLTGDNVPLADQLKTTEKLRVVELLLRVNEMKANGMQDPSKLANSDLESQVKKLSVKTIEQLLIQQKSDKTTQEKNEVISNLDDGSLSIEEKAYLSSLPLTELLKLLEETNQGGKTDDSK